MTSFGSEQQVQESTSVCVCMHACVTATAFPFYLFVLAFNKTKCLQFFFGMPKTFYRVVLVLHAERQVCFQRSLVVFGPVQRLASSLRTQRWRSSMVTVALLLVVFY